MENQNELDDHVLVTSNKWLSSSCWHGSRHSRMAGYLSVLGGFVIQMSLGGIYVYDNTAPYIISYMRNHTKGADNVSVESFWLWIFDFAVFGFGSSMALGGFIEIQFGAFVTLILGGWLMSLSIALCYWTIEVHVVLFAATHGLVAGIGAGIAYSVSMAAPVEWFPHSRGMVTGILVAGFGLGPMFFDFLQAYYINHDVGSVQINNLSSVPISFLLIGSLFGTIQLLAALIVNRRHSLTESDEECQECVTIPLFKSHIDMKPHQLILERDFWILWISYSLNASVSIMVLTLHKAFGAKLLISGTRLVSVSEAAGLCNGVGRLLCGYLIDKIAYKVLMSIVTLLTSLMIGTFYLCSKMDHFNEATYAMYFVWVAMLHLTVGSNYSIYPATCVKLFGVRHFASNYGLLFTAFSFGSIITSVSTFHLLENASNLGGFMAPFTVGCGLSLLSLVVTQFYLGKLRHMRNHLDS